MTKTASLFSQMLQYFLRDRFATLVKDTGADKHAKGFSCWTQFVAMLGYTPYKSRALGRIM